MFYLSVISSLIVFSFFFNDMLILNFTQYFNQSIYNEYNTQKCIRILVYIFSNLCLYKLNNNIFFLNNISFYTRNLIDKPSLCKNTSYHIYQTRCCTKNGSVIIVVDGPLQGYKHLPLIMFYLFSLWNLKYLPMYQYQPQQLATYWFGILTRLRHWYKEPRSIKIESNFSASGTTIPIEVFR